MDNLTLEFDQFLRSVEISKNDAFTFLLGAGASVTSGIPSAGECVWEWKTSIYETKSDSKIFEIIDRNSAQARIHIQKWLNSESVYPKENSLEEYSFYVKHCYPIEDDRRKYFQKLCEGKQPGLGYKLLPLLYETGQLKSIWTTNFDDLCRDSFIRGHHTVIDITLDSVDRIFRPLNNAELPIIKLHGDFKYGDLKNTAEELAYQDEHFREQMISYLNDKHLIVAGYSGRDVSIMETLKESYKKRGSGRLFWCGRGNFVTPEVKELLELARKNGREAFYISTEGFDNLVMALTGLLAKTDSGMKEKYENTLKSEKNEILKTPFTIEINRVNASLKSNLFPIKIPQEVFQFEVHYNNDERPWSTVKDLISDFDITAVPYKKLVWALGTITDISKAFGTRIQGKISRVPLKNEDLWKDTALYNLVLSSLTKLLAKRFQLDCNQKDLLWKRKHLSYRIIENIGYYTHQGIRFALFYNNTKFYLSMVPDFHITSDRKDIKISKSVKQEIGRTYFDTIRNKEYNIYLHEWSNLFFSSTNKFVEYEYPLNSGTGFVFAFSKRPAFAKIMKMDDPRNLNLITEKTAYLYRLKGIQYPEPKLLFGSKFEGMKEFPKDFHPMRGISQNQPYDHLLNKIIFAQSIHLAVICPKTDEKKVSNFLKQSNTKVQSNGKNKAYLIDYPCFFEAYGVNLDIPEVGHADWVECEEPELKGTLQETALQLRKQITDRIEMVTRDSTNKVVIIIIPQRWLPYTSYDIDNEYFDLHDYIKAYCAEKGIATQFIQEDTVDDTNLSCQINWWLSLSYFVKSMRTPWVLENLDKNTAFAGIGYSVSGKGADSKIVLGCSHIYNSKGQGLKYRLSKVEDQLFWDRQDRPHLSYSDAFKFGHSILEMFYQTMNELPKRVVIHKRTYYTEQELNGLKDSLLSNGILDLELIEINFEEDIRFIASKLNQEGRIEIDGYAVPRGTCILLNQNSALLWTHGVTQAVQGAFSKYYLGGRYIPGPLKITKHLGLSNIGTIANEILGLTKMNWNSFDLYSQLPATVNSSNEIARIGKLLSQREGATYDYRYFI